MNEVSTRTTDLLVRARQGDTAALGALLQAYQARLALVAQRQLDGRIANRVGVSDVIQQTFLEAHRDFRQFRGTDEAELIAWLQRILDHNLAGVIRRHALVQKRAVQRERSLEEAAGSGPAWGQGLAADQSSPSQRAMRDEQAERLEQALATLPADQQRAVRLRHLEGWSLAAIAGQLNRTPAAAANLIKRGLQGLRQRLREPDLGVLP